MAAELARLEAEAAALQSRIERQERELSRVKTSHRSTLIRERIAFQRERRPPAPRCLFDRTCLPEIARHCRGHRRGKGRRRGRRGAHRPGRVEPEPWDACPEIGRRRPRSAGPVGRSDLLAGLASDGHPVGPSTALLEVGKWHRTVSGRAARRLLPLSAASGDHPLQKLPSHGVMTAQSVAR